MYRACMVEHAGSKCTQCLGHHERYRLLAILRRSLRKVYGDFAPMITGFFSYIRRIAGRSFHGTLRWLEIAEAVLAVTVYSVGYFDEHLGHQLKGLFVLLLISLFVTFFAGLFWSAYKYDTEQRTAISEYVEQMKPKITLLLDRI